MCTCSSSNIPVEYSPHPTSSNPKRRNRRRSKQPFILEESLVDTMADQRTMAELLLVPTEGYAEAIVAPLILAEQFELKHSLINMMTSDQFFRLEKDNPHDHIRWKQGKLNPRYIRPFKILKRIGPVAYKLELHEELSNIHSTFHISNLKKCVSDKSLVISMKELWLDEKLNFVEEPVEIIDREVKQLKQSRIAIIKGELKAITTQSGIVLDGPFVPIHPLFINSKEDERVEETLTDGSR
nr:reverse transcriptase domain-containing protein [Tanacetum cinerariifolium]